MANNAQIELGR